MKGNETFFGAERTERWRAVVAVEEWELLGLNVGGAACGNCDRGKHRGRAWAKGQGLGSGWDQGTPEGFRTPSGNTGTV